MFWLLLLMWEKTEEKEEPGVYLFSHQKQFFIRKIAKTFKHDLRLWVILRADFDAVHSYHQFLVSLGIYSKYYLTAIQTIRNSIGTSTSIPYPVWYLTNFIFKNPCWDFELQNEYSILNSEVLLSKELFTTKARKLLIWLVQELAASRFGWEPLLYSMVLI
jgi:hypothetical protein